MRRCCAVWVSLVTTVLFPVFAVYAAESLSTGVKPNPEMIATLPPADALRYSVPLAAPPARPGDFGVDPAIGAASSSTRAGDWLFGSLGARGSAGLMLTPAPGSSRPGWEISGRVGPLRFLSPLDGEGETQLRFGGRVPGQPRMPGMGLFNLGIHYNFE